MSTLSNRPHRQTSPQLEKQQSTEKRRPSISTIPNYTIAVLGRSPNVSNASPITPVSSNPNRYSFGEYHFPANQVMPSVAGSPEHIIDLMEREQDAIVLKLMKEIETLKNENKSLRLMHGSTGSSLSSASSAVSGNGVRRSSSMSSGHRTSNSITSISSTGSTPCNSNKRNSALFHNYSIAQGNPILDDTIKLQKSEKEVSPTTKLARSRSRTGSMSTYDLAIEENKFMKLELKRLRLEIEVLKR